MTHESIQRVKKIAALMAAFVLISGTAAIAAPKVKKDMPQQSQPDGQVWQDVQNQKASRKEVKIREMKYKQGGKLLVVFGYPEGNGYPPYPGYPGRPGNPGKHYGNNIRWDKNQPITITDRFGRTYNTRVVRSENNVLELIVDGLYGGSMYNLNIGGVYLDDVINGVNGEFWAKDNWQYRN
ncbi:MAG: hypothetical protein U2P59_02105 [Synergistota bacterium]|nr:hypothetical protein [Synergistota bacterium]